MLYLIWQEYVEVSHKKNQTGLAVSSQGGFSALCLPSQENLGTNFWTKLNKKKILTFKSKAQNHFKRFFTLTL